VNIERIPFDPEELRVLADLTVELTKLRQNECPQLLVESVGPEIWGKLLHATYPPPAIFLDSEIGHAVKAQPSPTA
jgi:hypothetical protein